MAGSNATLKAEVGSEGTNLSAKQKRELVQRVLLGQMFNRAPAMRAFLLYITEHAISGQADKLKEQIIGAEVLGRKATYDPADDNIVRVRAHELRGRLEKYFATDGANEPVIITMPKGSYAPEFQHRKPLFIEPVEELAAISAERPKITRSKTIFLRPWFYVSVALVTLAAMFFFARVMLNHISRAATVQSTAIHDFWGQFFPKPNDELRVVYADTNFALWQDMSGNALDLGNYLSREYLNVEGDKLREVATRRSTSPADLTTSVHLALLAASFGGQLNLQFARNTSVDFLHHGNDVLIGSRRSNPWVEVYEPDLNFVLEQDSVTGAPYFRNRSPHASEQATYAIPSMLDIKGDEQKEFISYGVIALLKGCGDRGLIVIAEGLNMQATQAAGEIVTDPQRLDLLLHSIGHHPGVPVAPFDALFQITSIPGGYHDPKVIAYRNRPADSCVGQ